MEERGQGWGKEKGMEELRGGEGRGKEVTGRRKIGWEEIGKRREEVTGRRKIDL